MAANDCKTISFSILSRCIDRFSPAYFRAGRCACATRVFLGVGLPRSLKASKPLLRLGSAIFSRPCRTSAPRWLPKAGAQHAAAAEALELLAGRIAPLDVLLRGEGSRWEASLQLDEDPEDRRGKMMRGLLLLMHAKGTAPKDLYPPQVSSDSTAATPENVDPDTILDLTNISSCKNQESMKDDKEALLTSDRLPHIKRLTGLFCDKDKKWARQLLDVLAPYLEEVHLYNFHLGHLEAVQKMPQLQWLVLEYFNDTVPEDYKLPRLQHQSKVEFLWCNVTGHKNENLCSDIIKSHAASVKVLLSAVPSFHKDAVKFFVDLNLPQLKTLFYLSSYCGSDNCRDTMDALRCKYPELKVICFKCRRTDTYDE